MKKIFEKYETFFSIFFYLERINNLLFIISNRDIITK